MVIHPCSSSYSFVLKLVLRELQAIVFPDRGLFFFFLDQRLFPYSCDQRIIPKVFFKERACIEDGMLFSLKYPSMEYATAFSGEKICQIGQLYSC
jgi:hypothetical protein